MDKKMETSGVLAINECAAGGGGDDDDGPRRAALHNEIILGAIFSHLDTQSVKNAREVCKVWEAEGSIILGERCHLPLYCIFNDYTTTDASVHVNPKLMQRISIPIHPHDHYHVRNPDNVGKHFAFASSWHSVVKEIEIEIDIRSLGFPGTLNAHAFPNLTKMTIHYKSGTHPGVYPPFAFIHTLKEIKIVIEKFFETSGYPLLLNLINSAPNLEVLEIEGNFYPNLALCGKLKVLKFFGFLRTTEMGRWGTWWRQFRDFEPDELIRMLNEVKGRLEHLVLGLTRLVLDYPIPIINKDFPNLPKLKSLTIKSVDVLRMVEQICPSLLPSLEIVAFCGPNLLEFSGIDQGSYLTHHGVNSLEQLFVNRPDELIWASKKFPNVNRLVIGILEQKEERVKNDEYLRTILQACSTWKLRYLELHVKKLFKMSQFLEGLKALILLEGIKHVRIIAVENLFYDDLDLNYNFKAFEEVLQLSAKMDRMIFKGILVKTTTKEKVSEFLHQHMELPVYYLD